MKRIMVLTAIFLVCKSTLFSSALYAMQPAEVKRQVAQVAAPIERKITDEQRILAAEKAGLCCFDLISKSSKFPIEIQSHIKQFIVNPWQCMPAWMSNQMLDTQIDDSETQAIMPFSETCFITGHDDGHIKIWQILDQNKCICAQTFEAHTDRVTALCKISDTCIMSGSHDETIAVWRLIEGNWNCVQRIQCSDMVCALLKMSDNCVIIGIADIVRALNLRTDEDDNAVWEMNELVGLGETHHSNMIATLFKISDTSVMGVTVDETIKVFTLAENRWRLLRTLNPAIDELPLDILRLLCIDLSNGYFMRTRNNQVSILKLEEHPYQKIEQLKIYWEDILIPHCSTKVAISHHAAAPLSKTKFIEVANNAHGNIIRLWQVDQQALSEFNHLNPKEHNKLIACMRIIAKKMKTIRLNPRLLLRLTSAEQAQFDALPDTIKKNLKSWYPIAD